MSAIVQFYLKDGGLNGFFPFFPAFLKETAFCAAPNRGRHCVDSAGILC